MYIDFNKKDMDLLEYREVVKQFLKKNKKYNKDLYYFEDMMDYLCDTLVKKDKKYNPDRGSLSTYRYIAFKSALATFLINLKKKKDCIHLGGRQIELSTDEKSMADTIDKDERHRVYDMAMDIITERMKTDIKYKCFYDWAILDKRKKEISDEVGVTKTCIGHYINSVKESLRRELVNTGSADVWRI